MIIRIERSNVILAFILQAILFTLIGLAKFHYQDSETKASIVLAHYEVMAQEHQVNRYGQIISTYDCVTTPVIADNEVPHE